LQVRHEADRRSQHANIDLDITPAVGPIARQDRKGAIVAEPPTAKGQRRRQSLLDAARTVFETKGYFDTRVADIVSHAHVSHGTFYMYFDSKDDILRCLIDQLVETLYADSQTTDTPGLGPEEHLEDTIRQFLRTYHANAKMMRILEQVVTFDEGFREIRLGIITRFIDRITFAIETLQKRGLSDPDLNPRYAAHALGGMVGDFAFAMYVLRQDLDEATAVETMTKLWSNGVGLGRTSTRRRRPGWAAAR
jgi:AcrR family transcriptional regulator